MYQGVVSFLVEADIATAWTERSPSGLSWITKWFVHDACAEYVSEVLGSENTNGECEVGGARKRVRWVRRNSPAQACPPCTCALLMHMHSDHTNSTRSIVGQPVGDTAGL